MSFETNGIDIRGTSKIKRILVVRLSAMGDVIHTLPAVHLLRETFPEAHIGWLIEERWAELLCAPGAARRGPCSAARPLVDEVHTVQLKEWKRFPFSFPTAQAVAKAWNDVRDLDYDAAIDLQGAIRSAVLARWSGARLVYGSAEAREAPASLWYSRKVIPRGQHVVEQNWSVVQGMLEYPKVISLPDIHFDFPLDERVEAETDRHLAQQGIGEFAILNPGAGWGAKRWPAERYGEVARALAEMKICPLVNHGPGEEDLFRAVLAASGGRAKPATGSIARLIALARRARIFIGGDTGPLHLAAALRIPVVGIYGPTDPARNGPFGTRSIVLRSAESVTSHVRRGEPEDGLLGIGSKAVVEAAGKLLAGKLGG
jgi:heptosyltransferase-1